MRSLVLLLTFMAIGGCTSTKGTLTCRPPSDAERVYPFTGEWIETEDNSLFCIYQMDAKSAMVWIEGNSRPGVITRDGSLVIADRLDGDLHLYVARLANGNLHLEQSVSAANAEGRLSSGEKYKRETSLAKS